MKLQETTQFDGRSYEVTWQDVGNLPPRNQVTQVSAICYSSDNQIVMISGDGCHWGIPGGHPESEESLEEALRREVREEACCDINQMRLLGWQHVRDKCDNSVHYQLRYCCLVNVETFRPEHEIAYRQLIAPDEFLDRLEYGTSVIAQEMFALAQKTLISMKSEKQ